MAFSNTIWELIFPSWILLHQDWHILLVKIGLTLGKGVVINKSLEISHDLSFRVFLEQCTIDNSCVQYYLKPEFGGKISEAFEAIKIVSYLNFCKFHS